VLPFFYAKLKDFFTAEAQRRRENLFVITAPAAQLIKNSASPRLCGSRFLKNTSYGS
jgi:hypothetical protein